MSTVVSDLQGVLDLAVKKGETQVAFSERLARKANDMQEEDWETLDNDTQLWVNAAIEAISRSEAIPMPSGIDFLISETPEEAEEVSTPVKKKANGKKPVKAVVKEDLEAEGIETEEPEDGDIEGTEEVPAAKPKKEAKKPAKQEETSEEEAPARGPRGKFSGEDTIKLLVKENPFREGTKANGWFALIEDGATMADAIKAGAPRSHIRWAHSLGHIKIG